MLHKHHICVHGYIKKENIVFNDDKDISYLIDFDLVKKEGGKYPEGFRFFEGACELKASTCKEILCDAEGTQ